MGAVNISGYTFSTCSTYESPAMRIADTHSTVTIQLTTRPRPDDLYTQKVFTISNNDYPYLRPMVTSDSLVRYEGYVSSQSTSGYSGSTSVISTTATSALVSASLQASVTYTASKTYNSSRASTSGYSGVSSSSIPAYFATIAHRFSETYCGPFLYSTTSLYIQQGSNNIISTESNTIPYTTSSARNSESFFLSGATKQGISAMTSSTSQAIYYSGMYSFTDNGSLFTKPGQTMRFGSYYDGNSHWYMGYTNTLSAAKSFGFSSFYPRYGTASSITLADGVSLYFTSGKSASIRIENKTSWTATFVKFLFDTSHERSESVKLCSYSSTETSLALISHGGLSPIENVGYIVWGPGAGNCGTASYIPYAPSNVYLHLGTSASNRNISLTKVTGALTKFVGNMATIESHWVTQDYYNMEISLSTSTNSSFQGLATTAYFTPNITLSSTSSRYTTTSANQGNMSNTTALTRSSASGVTLYNSASGSTSLSKTYELASSYYSNNNSSAYNVSTVTTALTSVSTVNAMTSFPSGASSTAKTVNVSLYANNLYRSTNFKYYTTTNYSASSVTNSNGAYTNGNMSSTTALTQASYYSTTSSTIGSMSSTTSIGSTIRV